MHAAWCTPVLRFLIELEYFRHGISRPRPTLTPSGSEGGQTGACSSDAAAATTVSTAGWCTCVGRLGECGARCNAPTPTHVTARRLVRRVVPGVGPPMASRRAGSPQPRRSPPSRVPSVGASTLVMALATWSGRRFGVPAHQAWRPGAPLAGRGLPVPCVGTGILSPGPDPAGRRERSPPRRAQLARPFLVAARWPSRS